MVYENKTVLIASELERYKREEQFYLVVDPVLVDHKGESMFPASVVKAYAEYLLPLADLVTPNLAEFEAIVGPCESEDDLVEKGRRLCEQYSFEALLITRSEHGMTLIQNNGEVFHLPTRAREVYDVTGAGDTVIATLALGLAVGLSHAEAAAIANYAAGIVVGKVGTATASPEELLEVMA